MKKLIYIFLLLPFISIAQTANGTETKANAFRALSPQTVTSSSFITTTGTDGTQGKILGENISLSVIPPVTNFTPVTTSIKGYFQGVDNKFGSIVQTTAGITNRIWFTGDISVVNVVNYFTSNAQSKGIVTAASPTPLVNNDDQKSYFTQDIIGNAFPSIQKFPAGTYAGNLSVRVSPNSASQRYTVEIYKTNNLGVPIASGITGAPVGDLGVTVVAILDSGVINLADNSITNIPVNGILASELTINATERIRYHVSAAKVGTAGASITMEVFYGSSYNSYYDVPVTFDTNSVKDVSAVTNGTGTVTDALNSLKDAIPVNYSKIVYVNNTNPNSATIFDDENPPTVNDNTLKTDVTNLYIGTDASGWVYNGTSLTYVTKSTPSISSVWNNEGSGFPANTTTAPIERSGKVSLNVLNANLFSLFANPIGSTPNKIAQQMGGTDVWRIYGSDAGSDKGILVFEVGDDAQPIGSLGQSFEFRYNATGGGVAKTPFTIDYNTITALTNMSVSGNVTANAIDTNTTKITITTSISITTATTDANGIRQDGRHVVIDNGVNVINLTCNGGVTASYGKVGTGAITFVQGSGRTLVQLSGTAVFNGIAGSTATLWSNGTTDYLAINNY